MKAVEMIGRKLILVTGCNTGLGFAIVKNLALKPENHDFIMAVRSIERGKIALEELEKLVPSISKRITLKELDISKSEIIDNFIKWIKDSGLKVDCLINNAGIFIKGDINEEIVNTTFRTNFYGTVEFTEKMLHYITDSGKIITVTGSLGKLIRLESEELKKEFTNPMINREMVFELAKRYHDDVVDGTYDKKGWPKLPYIISKLCLNVYIRIFGKDPEILKRGIQVYACCPGKVKTGMAGPHANRTPDEGSVCPCDLVYFPWTINPELQGNFFFDSKVTPL